MEKDDMRGIYSIPVTPFNEDGSLDYKSLKRCIEFCIEMGAHGIVTPVNASEGPFINEKERDKIFKLTGEIVNNSVPFVAGVTAVTIHQAVRNALVAVEYGAESVIAAPPTGSTDNYIFDYFSKIAESAQVPVWIQNNKPPTSPTIRTSTIIKMLQEIPYVDYVKEESQNPGHVMTEILDSKTQKCRGVMGGMGGRFIIDEYIRGSCGSMPAGHLTDVHRILWDALEEGRENGGKVPSITDNARTIWEAMLPSLNFEFLHSISAYKMVFYKRGIIKSPTTRNPAAKKLDKNDIRELDTILKRLEPLISEL